MTIVCDKPSSLLFLSVLDLCCLADKIVENSETWKSLASKLTEMSKIAFAATCTSLRIKSISISILIVLKKIFIPTGLEVYLYYGLKVFQFLFLLSFHSLELLLSKTRITEDTGKSEQTEG